MSVREAARNVLKLYDVGGHALDVRERAEWLDRRMEALRKALEADTVEVPRAPTREMVSAARRWLDLEDRRLAIVGIYRTMIAAASEPETGAEG